MAETKDTQMAVSSEGRPVAASTKAPSSIIPPVDIYENDDGIILIADMPGVGKDSLEVQVDKNILTIKGTIEDIVPKELKPLYAEFTGKEYERAFTLGPDVDVSKIEANMNAGVLKLMLPKAEEVKPRRIEVKAG